MRAIELCAGPNQSFTNVIKSICEYTLTIDIEKYEGIDIKMDLSKRSPPYGVEGELYDIMWASVPCQTYSIAGIRHHRREAVKPISRTALIHDDVVRNVLLYVKTMLAMNPNFKFVIENPRGCLRKMPFMQEWNKYRKTVTYCQYGDFRMKPTDLWTNIDFDVRMCKNGASCHESSPRGSQRGTTSLNWKDRNKVPKNLILEILKGVKK